MVALEQSSSRAISFSHAAVSRSSFHRRRQLLCQSTHVRPKPDQPILEIETPGHAPRCALVDPGRASEHPALTPD